MKRLTKKVDGAWTAICEYGNPPYPVVTQDVIDRLAAIEDILGDEYDLERLKFIMDAERHGGLIVRYPRDDPGPKGPPVFAPVAGDTRGYPGTQKQTYLLVLCAAGPIQRPHYGGSRNDRD